MFDKYELNVMARMVLPDGDLADENEDPEVVYECEHDTLAQAVSEARRITPEWALSQERRYGKNGLDVFVCRYTFDDRGEQEGCFEVPYEASWHQGEFFDDPTYEEPVAER